MDDVLPGKQLMKDRIYMTKIKSKFWVPDMDFLKQNYITGTFWPLYGISEFLVANDFFLIAMKKPLYVSVQKCFSLGQKFMIYPSRKSLEAIWTHLWPSLNFP